jgi:hypothetical protein
MRAIVLSVVLIASPALAQQTPATPAPYSAPVTDAPVSTATPPQAAPFQATPVTPDSAQVPQAIDPLGDLISQSSLNTDEEEAETASKPAPKHRATILPIPPPEAQAPAGGELTKAQVYEMRVKGSIAAAQNLQGPLDGGWNIAGPDGSQLYALQIVDKAGGYGELEGAWRDVRRPGTVGSTGLVEDLRRDGADVVIRFSPKGGQSSVLTLRPVGDTRWSGQLVENGATEPVMAEHVLPQAPALCLAGRPARRRQPSGRGSSAVLLDQGQEGQGAEGRQGQVRGGGEKGRQGQGLGAQERKGRQGLQGDRGQEGQGDGRQEGSRQKEEALGTQDLPRCFDRRGEPVGGIGAGRAVAPDGAGPGRIVLAPADHVDMQLGGDIA